MCEEEQLREQPHRVCGSIGALTMPGESGLQSTEHSLPAASIPPMEAVCLTATTSSPFLWGRARRLTAPIPGCSGTKRKTSSGVCASLPISAKSCHCHSRGSPHPFVATLPTLVAPPSSMTQAGATSSTPHSRPAGSRIFPCFLTRLAHCL